MKNQLTRNAILVPAVALCAACAAPTPDIGAFENLDRIFDDGFEAGSTTAWSSAAP